MKIIGLFLLSMAFCAQIYAKEAHIRLLPIKKIEETRLRAKPMVKRSESSLYEKVLKSNEEIKKLLLTISAEPVIWDGNKTILTGKVFRGILLNSIVSTNLGSPVLVRSLPDQGLPFGTLFSCKGATKHRRIITLCDKMVTKEKEVPIVAQVLNVDGSAGLLGEYDDGKEDLITGAILSEVASGVLSVAQNKVATPFGSYSDSTTKNQVLGGLIRGSQSGSDILLEEMKTKEPIVTINSGEEVLIYFMEAIYEY